MASFIDTLSSLATRTNSVRVYARSSKSSELSPSLTTDICPRLLPLFAVFCRCRCISDTGTSTAFPV